MKLQVISNLATTTTRELSSAEKWKSFLDTAAWHYKYSFEDQVLIYAQRPDARACADFETWGEKLNRRIKRGAKGIALLRERGSKFYLDHVFDVSDTYSRIPENEIRLWKYDEKYEGAIIETLENRFGEFWYPSDNISDAVICTAKNIVADGKADYISNLSDVLYSKDSTEIDKSFQEVAENSVAYMTMVRLGIDTDEKFVFEDFARISGFDNIESVSILGDAVSAFSEEVLREIQSTLIAEVKKEKETKFAENENIEYSKDENIIQNERSKENVTDNVSQRERNTDTEPESPGERQADREIRNDEEEVPQTEQTGTVRSNDDTGDIDGASSGDRPDGEDTGRSDGTENGEIGGRGREAESTQSAEVDRSYEQPQTFRRSVIL